MVFSCLINECSLRLDNSVLLDFFYIIFFLFVCYIFDNLSFPMFDLSVWLSFNRIFSLQVDVSYQVYNVIYIIVITSFMGTMT